MTKKPFESKWLRQDVEKIIARQQRGEILVTTDKANWPLPYLHDVPGLQRERDGYNSPWGRFQTTHAPRGVCVFHPAEGNKRPPVWKEYDLNAPIQLASAVIDPARYSIS